MPRFGVRFGLIVIVLGMFAGLGLGLALAWAVFPVDVTSVDVSDLKGTSQQDYIVLTASAYVYDQDLAKAKERLAVFNDTKIGDRIGTLANQLAGENSPDALNLAILAVALGNRDQSILRLAVTPTPLPTSTATPPLQNLATPIPTITSTRLPTSTPLPATATATRSRTPTARATSTRTPTSSPSKTPTSSGPAIAPTTRPPATATTASPANPIAGTLWIPSPTQSEWPGGLNFQPANVPVGQKFWHLVRGLYCDDRDQRNDCPNRPGGETGTGIYIMLLNASGGRATAPLLVTKDDGSLATVNDIGPEKSADDPCNCNYSYLANSWQIRIGGATYSDMVSGLGLYSVRMKLPQAHVRYFLTFQLLTR